MTRLIMRSRPDAGHLATLAHGLIIAALIVVLLIAGREILEPLVIAALLAFILSPLIRRLRQWGVWRIPSVVLAVSVRAGRHRRAERDHWPAGYAARSRFADLRNQPPQQDQDAGSRQVDLRRPRSRIGHACGICKRRSPRQARPLLRDRNRWWSKFANPNQVALNRSPPWCGRCCHRWR